MCIRDRAYTLYVYFLDLDNRQPKCCELLKPCVCGCGNKMLQCLKKKGKKDSPFAVIAELSILCNFTLPSTQTTLIVLLRSSTTYT